MSTPSYMLAIADEFERQGVDPRDTTLRLGLFGAEPWTEGMRREIEARFGIDAVDLYGLSEVMGPGVAVECVETKDGPTSGRTTSIPRSSTRRPAARSRTASPASWCSRRSPRKRCRSSATARAT